MLRIFDNPAALVAAYTAAGCPRTHNGDNTYWLGGTIDGALHDLRNGGNEKHVSAARALLDKIMPSLPASHVEAWSPDIAGAYPSVPDFLAGAPDCMRRRIRQESDSAPVHILINTVSSGGIPAADLTRRGVACLALAMALQATRGVRLYIAATLHGADTAGRTEYLVRVPSEPLSLAEACTILCDGAVTRGILYGLGRHENGFDGGWPRGASGAGITYMRGLAARAGMPEDTIILTPPSLGHGDDLPEMKRDPVAWVKARLAPFMPQD
jgi:hypothetical protein